jgi:A/G-specific adenine glycosylase
VQNQVASLLRWFAVAGRDFPWRHKTSSYAVLLAEILLRQTRAESVSDVLDVLLNAYPTPRALAAADEGDIATVINRLGFGHQRAHQLKRLAQMVVRLPGSQIPRTAIALRQLPGVGAYTAGLVAATCFGEPQPAVDTNVARVLCRLHGLLPSHSEPRKSANVWSAAAALISVQPRSAARVTWALVDLGSSTCTARKPACGACPLASSCFYLHHQQGAETI